MVRIDRVITRGGDGGETSLGDGSRVPKDALRVEAYGTLDEANAAIGVLRLHTLGDAEADAMLARIQNDLFDAGADLCVPGEAGERLRLGDLPSARLEAEVAARRTAGGGACPCRPHRGPPRRAAGGGAVAHRAGEPGNREVSQPLVRPSVRARPTAERQRLRGRAVGPRSQPLV